jgi:mRNA interferase MazF
MARGDILLVSFPMPANSREQQGFRPAVEVQSNQTDPALPTTLVVPFTTTLGARRFAHTHTVQPSAANGLSAPSVLMAFQLRAIDKDRIERKIGVIEPADLAILETEMRALLGI